MKLPCILTADIHLTANPADEYRWQLFPWLAKELAAEKAQTLAILGDLTESKDMHPSELVNRVVREIDKLRKVVPRIVILMGNHDLLKKDKMFFEFLNAMSGVDVITKLTEDFDGELTMWLPFTRTPMQDWKGLDFSHYQYLFMHATAPGSVASNGQKMEGDVLPPLNAGKVYSGDIHVPQVVGEIEYVGSPMHIHFGDNFKPRCIVLEHTHNAVDLHFSAPRRVMLDVVDAKAFEDATAGLERADQVKVRLALPEADKHRWRAVKADIEGNAEYRGIDLVSIELRVQKSNVRVVAGDRPAAMFDPVTATYNWVDANDLGPELLDAALECIKGE